MTPLKAIRKYCLGCVGSVGEVRHCEDDSCSLHIYRFGKNPNRSGVGVISNITSGRKNNHSTSDFSTQSTGGI